MTTAVSRKLVPHTPEEQAWVQEKVDSGMYTMKAIEANNLLEELEERFGRKLGAHGMYSWFRYLKNPGLKQSEKDKAKSTKQEGKSSVNAKFMREKETFEKSNLLAYINHNIVGFESDNDLKEFMVKNQVMGENVFVFKRIPIKIEYSVQLG